MIGRWNTKSREHIKDSRFHMKTTRNIRLSRHQMFAILRLKRNGIALQRKRKGGGGLFVTKSEMLSVLPALFIKVKQVNGVGIDDLLLSDDSQRWLDGGVGEEKHTHHVCIRHRPETRHVDVCPHFCHALWGGEKRQKQGEAFQDSRYSESFAAASSALSRLFVYVTRKSVCWHLTKLLQKHFWL